MHLHLQELELRHLGGCVTVAFPLFDAFDKTKLSQMGICIGAGL